MGNGLESDGKKAEMEEGYGLLGAMALDTGALHSTGGCF